MSCSISVQTSNHYLKAAKQFTRWLVRDRRTPSDPLAHLSRLNVRTDRRHDRRAAVGRRIRAARKCGPGGEARGGHSRAG